mgnify:CR=1 FL=1
MLMDPLPHEPRNFRELVEADLRRAARLIIKIQDEIDWQFRIATPKGDLHLAVTMPGGVERDVMLARIGTFMHWKQAKAFIMAVETVLPNGVYAAGLSPTERCNCFAHFDHEPRPWTARNFHPVKWLPEKHIDPVIAALLPTSPRAMTPKEVSGLHEWFGREGRFPAVQIESGTLEKL